MSARRMCSKNVDVVRMHETVCVAAQRMQSRNVGALVVVCDKNEVLGIVTDRDLATRVVAAGRDPNFTLVEEVMTRRPRTISEETPIDRAIEMMRTGGFRRLPVVDHEKLCGILTLDDVVRIISRELQDVTQLILQEGPQALAEAAHPVGATA